MPLSITQPPYVIPEYSLTGDLLAYRSCGLQYRYYNRGTLPPSRPVQLWFGEFIHGVLEEAYIEWKSHTSLQRFPWSWATDIRPMELLINTRLHAKGLWPPPNLFCWRPAGVPHHCADPNHKLLASRRADASINTWGQHLFPIVAEAEVHLKGCRPMPGFRPGVSRSNYYAVTGVADVISSVNLLRAPAGNLVVHYLRQQPAVQALLARGATGFDVIIDYKGMRRPGTTDPAWLDHEQQVLTYAWLRTLQPGTQPVAAGILLYLNELEPSGEDMQALQLQVQSGTTDCMPSGVDASLISGWRPRTAVPALTTPYRELRSIRVIPVDSHRIANSLQHFDGVVQSIEGALVGELGGSPLFGCWTTNPVLSTCTACDFQWTCPNPAGGPYTPTVP